MLRPDERAHLLELLRPPSGCQLDCAVGTTFSLDLISALMLPLSFAFFDWEDTDGKIIADPLALLEALRRYGNRFTVFLSEWPDSSAPERHCHVNELSPPSSPLSPDFGAGQQARLAFPDPKLPTATPRSIP
jgi:hypothetical protein